MSSKIQLIPFLTLTLTTLGMASACNSTLFSGTTPPTPRKPITLAPHEKDVQPSPNPTGTAVSIPTVAATIAPTPVATPKIVPTVPLRLSVERLKSASWWKNCLTVTLNDQVKEIGCNKDQNVLGKVVTFEALRFPTCNTLKVSISTFKNQGDTCSNNLKQNIGCPGPYGEFPSWTRNTNDTNGKSFFRTYDSKTIAKADKLIRSGYDYVDLQKQFFAYVNAQPHTWLRVFFEDQPLVNLEAAQKNPANSESLGIDFDDYVFDIKGENVNAEIEGTDTKCVSP